MFYLLDFCSMSMEGKKGLLVTMVALMVLTGNVLSQNQLTGLITYGGDETKPLTEVDVGLYDLQEVLILSASTDYRGIYEFDSVPDGEYYLRSVTDAEPGGIDLQDAHYILRHLLGIEELNNIQYEAADVNNSGSVSWNDYFLILINYLLEGDPFPAGEWQFQEHYINLVARDNDNDTSNVWGISEGDVTIDWEPSGRSFAIMNSSLYQVEVENNEIQVEINSDYFDNISGFNLNLEYPTELIELTNIEGPDKNLKYKLDEENGLLSVIWLNELGRDRIVNGDQLLTLTIIAKNNIDAHAAFTLLPESMLLDANGEKLENAEIQLPQLNMKATSIEVEVAAYPNPVVDKLNITINVPVETQAGLKIYNLQGQVIDEIKDLRFTEGKQSLSVNTQNYKPGHYFYVINWDSGAENSRILGRFYRSSP